MDTVDNLSTYAIEELCSEYLADKVDEDVIATFRKHKIGGSVFVALDDQQLKELFPILGDRMAVKQLLKNIRRAVPDQNDTSKRPFFQASNQDSSLVQSGLPSLMSSNWVHTFQIPDCFSCKTMKAIRTGQITKSARIEIIAAVHSRMIQCTAYPTPTEYRTACQRLVDKYPTLADKLGSRFGSWKEQLKQKFRNGRRADPGDAKEKEKENRQPNLVDDVGESPAKKQRRCTAKSRIASEVETTTDEKHEENMQALSEELQKENPRTSKIKLLMKQTFSGRRQWIVQDSPSVKDVLKVFPCLKDSSRLHRELTLILGVPKSTEFLKDWPTWRSKILEHARREAPTRPAVNSLLQQYCSEDEEQLSSDCEGLCCLKLLSVFLASKAKIQLVYEFPASTDLKTKAAEIDATSPYIVVTTTDEETKQYFVIVEKEVLLESTDMAVALQDLMAAYFTFNIAYPRQLYSVLVFLQHHVFVIKDNQPVPNVVKIVYSAMCM